MSKAVKKENSNPRKLTGVVFSTKMQETAVVKVNRYVEHAKYGKFTNDTKKYSVHNPGNKAQVGDTVTIVETKPISKTKRFIIVE